MMVRKFTGILLLLFLNAQNIKGICYPHPSYQVASDGLACRLHQPNWAPETFFEVKMDRCKDAPSFDVFIRNFNGIDEVNTKLSNLEPSITVTKFDGSPGSVDLGIMIFESNAKFHYNAHVQVKVYVDGEVLLTGVFIAENKSGCVWMDTLDAHNQAFLAGSVCLGFMALCAVLCCCCRKMGSRHTITRAPPMLLRDDGL